MKRGLVLGLVGVGAIVVTACAALPATNVTDVPEASAPTDAPPAAAPSGPTETAPVAEGAPSAPGGVVRLQIKSDESEARFVIDEILAGSTKTVRGVTTAVSGVIQGDFSDPQGVQIGPVTVDMSTLHTDNNFRNRALHDAILQTGVEGNRYAMFQATSFDGVPESVEFGTTYPVIITGDLTIHGVTRSVTFQGEVTPFSAERLEGTAAVSLPYADFDVRILRLPQQVASVGDIVSLEIDFVAVPE